MDCSDYKVLIIDDDRAYSSLLSDYVHANFPALEVIACHDPVQGLAAIGPGVGLLLIDLEMPGLDGSKVLAYALDKGFDKNRIIILSGHDAELLHRRFPMGRCLAVLNKHETRQKAVLDMVFGSLQKKCEAAAGR